MTTCLFTSRSIKQAGADVCAIVLSFAGDPKLGAICRRWQAAMPMAIDMIRDSYTQSPQLVFFLPKRCSDSLRLVRFVYGNVTNSSSLCSVSRDPSASPLSIRDRAEAVERAIDDMNLFYFFKGVSSLRILAKDSPSDGTYMEEAAAKRSWMHSHQERMDQVFSVRIDGEEKGLTRLPREVSLLRNVRFIRLPGHQITAIPQEIGKLSHLELLDLSNNRLETIPGEIGKCQALQQLLLCGNVLVAFPEEIGECTQLKKLDLSHNRIQQLPEGIGGCAHLQSLSLDHNRLRETPAGLFQCVELEHLFLNNNQITGLPRGVGHLTSLRELTLERNRLEELPEEIGQCRELEWLDVTHNRIRELPCTLGRCAKLKKVHLIGNHPATSA